MRTLHLRALGLVVAISLVASVAHASELTVHLYGLQDVVDSPGVAILGTLVAIDTARGTVKLLVERVWVAPGERAELPVEHQEQRGPDLVTVMSSAKVVAGETLEIPIYRGVVWDDPNVSPVDHRLRDHLEFDSLRVKKKVLLLSNELEAATPKELHKLDLFFAEGGIAKQLATWTNAALAEALGDFDLSVPARDELKKRGALGPGVLLAVKDARQRSQLLHHEWESATPEQRVALVGGWRQALDASPTRERVADVVRVVAYDLTPPMLPDAAALALLLPPAAEDLKHDLVRRITELQQAPNAPRASREVVEVLLQDQPREQKPEELVTWAHGLHADERDLLDAILLAQVQHGLAADRTGKAAWAPLRRLSALLVDRPDAAMNAPLCQLELLKLPFGMRGGFAEELLAVANAAARSDARTIPIFKPSLEALLASDSGDLHMHTVSDRRGSKVTAGIVQTVESVIRRDVVEEYRALFRASKP